MFRSPAATRWLGGVVAVVTLAACDSVQPTPVPTPTPTPQPGPAPAATVTVTATVLEFTADGQSRPLPNLRLKVWRSGSSGGVLDATALSDTVTDGSGRFTIPDVMPGTLFFRTVPGAEYRFICDAYPLFAHTELLRPPNTNLPVVHTSWSGTRPPQTWLIGTSFYGTVSERDAGGSLQPIAGATVDAGLPDPPATTDASGFYMTCSTTGSDQFRAVTVAKTGYNTLTRDVFLGMFDHVFNFELNAQIAPPRF